MKNVFSIQGQYLGADLADMQLIIKLIKDLDLHYVLLIFLANMHGLFL